MPMISGPPPQGSSSSADSGVWPEFIAVWLRRFFFRFRTRPLPMTTSFSYPDPSTSIDANPGVVVAPRHLQVVQRLADRRREIQSSTRSHAAANASRLWGRGSRRQPPHAAFDLGIPTGHVYSSTRQKAAFIT